jgi:SAM-dependent methyltransferase
VRWSRALLVPHVIRLGLRAPRDVATRWDRYWADVRATGDDGDVLWDSSSPGEAQRYLDLLVAHADPELPVVDVGCGNGRFTRKLASRFPRALGVDLSPHAIARAREEAAGTADVEFRAVDMLGPGAADDLPHPSNVFVRGVLHVLDAPAREALASAIGDLLGTRGTALIAETNYDGPMLGYLESLGAGPRGLPRPLARAIASGLPQPSRFGNAELDSSFPPARWERVLVDDSSRITTALTGRAGAPTTIPAYVAVLRLRG